MEKVKEFNVPLMTGEDLTMPLVDPAGAICEPKYESVFPWLNGVNAGFRVVINPDIDKAIDVLKKIKENHGFCPSYPVKEKTEPGISLVPDMRCPCPDMTCKGICKCGLFVNTPLLSVKQYQQDFGKVWDKAINKKEEEKE